jgi:endogenous inhibitor of DNA gyrase (YacG/DUF329 family)
MSGTYIRPLTKATNPCRQCGAAFEVANSRSKSRPYCSLKCAGLARRTTALKTCRICKRARPWEDFPFGRRPQRSNSCQDCFVPKLPGPRPPVGSPNPCQHCGNSFSGKKGARAMAARKFCSTACHHLSMRRATYPCQTCRQQLPGEDFDYQPCGKSPRRTCRACDESRTALKVAGIGFMPSVGHMTQHAKVVARNKGVPYTLADAEVVALRGNPCSLCGAKSAVVRAVWPEVGYVTGNVDGVCWLCFQWTNCRRGPGLSSEDMLRQARAIVQWHDAP